MDQRSTVLHPRRELGKAAAGRPERGLSATVITTVIPPEALTITAPPPALVTNRCPDHVGLTKRDLLEVLRAMKRDPRFAAEVIVYGKVRGATPAAVIAFLRERSAQGDERSATAANDGGDSPRSGVERLAAELGLERAEPAPPAERAGSRGGRSR